jgi:hypothetical protein
MHCQLRQQYSGCNLTCGPSVPQRPWLGRVAQSSYNGPSHLLWMHFIRLGVMKYLRYFLSQQSLLGEPPLCTVLCWPPLVFSSGGKSIKRLLQSVLLCNRCYGWECFLCTFKHWTGLTRQLLVVGTRPLVIYVVEDRGKVGELVRCPCVRVLNLSLS